MTALRVTGQMSGLIVFWEGEMVTMMCGDKPAMDGNSGAAVAKHLYDTLKEDIGSDVFMSLSAATLPKRIIIFGEIRLICLSKNLEHELISSLLGFRFSGGLHLTVFVI